MTGWLAREGERARDRRWSREEEVKDRNLSQGLRKQKLLGSGYVLSRGFHCHSASRLKTVGL